MKTTLLILAALFVTTPAFADCKQDYRKCARDCSWMHAACDMPSSPFCISENRKCMDSCDKENQCKANTLGGSPAAPETIPTRTPEETPATKPDSQEDKKQENQFQE